MLFASSNLRGQSLCYFRSLSFDVFRASTFNEQSDDRLCARVTQQHATFSIEPCIGLINELVRSDQFYQRRLRLHFQIPLRLREESDAFAKFTQRLASLSHDLKDLQGGDEAVASEDGPDGTDAPDEADDASAEDVEE